jgi:uncharacterized protein (DUF488 family)
VRDGAPPSRISGDLAPVSTLYSVGHGARPVDELVEALRATGIECLVDVRSFPGSRRHPQFGQQALSATLESVGIEYAWRKDLGGFRTPAPGSRHTALHSTGFRGYADHMESSEFESGLAWLIRSARDRRVTFMCAETLWWRCHRRMLADALEAKGHTVLHLMPGRRIESHRLNSLATIQEGRPVYDRAGPEQQTLA